MFPTLSKREWHRTYRSPQTDLKGGVDAQRTLQTTVIDTGRVRPSVGDGSRGFSRYSRIGRTDVYKSACQGAPALSQA